MSRREEIIAKIRTVPAIPTAAVKVSRILRDPDFEVSEVTHAITHDPALAANVLRMANSAYFSGPRTIGSIRQAIMRLGANRIYQFVIAYAVGPVASREVRGYDLPPGELWEHSVATAITTDLLAKELGLDPPDYTFTAALLSDIGKIVLGTFVEVDAGPIMELAFKEGLPFEEAEKKVLGIDHSEVSAILLESWNLPEYVVEVVRWHQQPENYEGDDQLVLDLVHTADALSMMGGIGTGSDGLNYRLSKDVAARLGMSVHKAEAVISRIPDKLNELRELIGAKSGR